MTPLPSLYRSHSAPSGALPYLSKQEGTDVRAVGVLLSQRVADIDLCRAYSSLFPPVGPADIVHALRCTRGTQLVRRIRGNVRVIRASRSEKPVPRIVVTPVSSTPSLAPRSLAALERAIGNLAGIVANSGRDIDPHLLEQDTSPLMRIAKRYGVDEQQAFDLFCKKFPYDPSLRARVLDLQKIIRINALLVPKQGMRLDLEDLIPRVALLSFIVTGEKPDIGQLFVTAKSYLTTTAPRMQD